MTTDQHTPGEGRGTRAFVAMVHVASLPRSIAFYAALDLRPTNLHHEPGCEEPVWAWMQSPGGAEFMLVQADGPIDDGVQGVLFYLYCDDVVATRERLLAAGLDAGPMSHPFYRPRGEFRLRDPDGYVLMITHAGD